MAIIKPFKALRPDPYVVHLVASVPYDVVSKDEAAELAKDFPINFLRVTRSEIEMDKSVNPYSPEVYQKAKEVLERIKATAPLIQDKDSHFYIYKLVWKNQSQVGIAATFSVEDYDNDVIKKHEKTRRVKEDDRTNHIVETKAQTGPVFLTYHGVKEVDNVVNKTMLTNPLYDFTTNDGVTHAVWILPDDYMDIIEYEISKVKNLYIADGHHRAASASRAQKMMKENNPNHKGDEEYNFFLAVLFPAEQLKILPYNRVLFDTKGLSKKELIKLFSKYFTVEKVDYAEPKNKGEICMYINSNWYSLKPNQNVNPGELMGDKLDVSILQNFLLRPYFDIEDPRTNENIDFIGGIRGTEELVRLVDSGKAKIAFSMYPVTVDDLIQISDAAETMPPKSTWFEPKLRDGILVHEI